MASKNADIIDFVKRTTEAIQIISDSTRQLTETTGAIKDMIAQQNITNASNFEKINGKVDGLSTMFRYVVSPLIGGILALVGVKLFFHL